MYVFVNYDQFNASLLTKKTKNNITDPQLHEL